MRYRLPGDALLQSNKAWGDSTMLAAYGYPFIFCMSGAPNLQPLPVVLQYFAEAFLPRTRRAVPGLTTTLIRSLVEGCGWFVHTGSIYWIFAATHGLCFEATAKPVQQ